MPMPTITDYLKYANLQMAAEAFLVDNDGVVKTNIKQALIDGNKHASVFTDSQADEFAAQWKIVDQRINGVGVIYCRRSVRRSIAISDSGKHVEWKAL